MAKMICLCGISGSGKTTWAKGFMAKHPDWLYFNPDEYYARINGDECDRRNVFEVWHSLFRDVHTAVLNNKNVLIDSNNLTFHQRMQWIEWFPEFEDFILIYFEEVFNICLERVNNRIRTIPRHKMIKQHLCYQRPKTEFDEVAWSDSDYWIIIKGDENCDSQLAKALKG